VIRTVLLLIFWGLSILIIGPFLLLYTVVSQNADVMYKIATGLAISGVRLAGIKIEVRGLEHLRRDRSYIFMSNHVSNLDPPVLIPSIPGRCSVLVKKELFRLPILGVAMKMARLVPVDRSNREAAVESVRAAAEVMHHGLNMVIFPEGTRSVDGRLLPFKKGPFHLAMETGIPVVPVTILGTAECWPKGTWAMKAGTATLVFHAPVDPANFADRDALMAVVRERIAGALPEDKRGHDSDAADSATEVVP
jgi:1-acyl-sn-glycerol-3-phosphate acyltransferase